MRKVASQLIARMPRASKKKEVTSFLQVDMFLAPRSAYLVNGKKKRVKTKSMTLCITGILLSIMKHSYCNEV